MIALRSFASLGGVDHGWLRARHHFSFAGYHDADRMGWGALRVWNDDEIAAGAGFPKHPHRDMEIVTYVRDGAITHEDSLGNRGRTGSGDVQVMSAGSGIRHSEYNLEAGTTRIFQIWLLPRAPGGAPHWGARPFPGIDRSGKFVVLASGLAEDAEALPIRSDARVLGATLSPGESLRYPLAPGRHAYMVPARGNVVVRGATAEVAAASRDGIAIRDEAAFTVTAMDEAEMVLVDTV